MIKTKQKTTCDKNKTQSVTTCETKQKTSCDKNKTQSVTTCDKSKIQNNL